MAGAIVVGAGPGLGAALGRRFARAGRPVTLVARHAAPLGPVAEQVIELGGPVLALEASATDEAGLRSALDRSLTEFGPPEVLVYNAAWIRRDRPGELSAADLLEAHAVNVVGAMTAAMHVAPAMAARGSGSILLTSGLPQPDPAFTSLSLGKAAGRALAAVLAEELGPAGIHVATITIHGAIHGGTSLAPEAIAECFWAVHEQPREQWEIDHQFTG